MPNDRFRIVECQNTTCRMRFPATVSEPLADRCPICHTATQTELTFGPAGHADFSMERRQNEVVGLIDNVRSANNVGAMLRSADGAGLAHLHLCGTTAQPDNRKVQKTSLGAENNVPWTYHRNGLLAVEQLQQQGFAVWCVEGGSGAQNMVDGTLPTPNKLVFVVGNEITGVDPAILKLCDKRIALPMRGIKESLNVAVAFGIAAYLLTN